MSGEVHGVDGILMRAEILDAFEVNVNVEHVVVGYKKHRVMHRKDLSRLDTIDT